MVTPKPGAASILSVQFIIQNPSVLGAGRPQWSTLSEGFRIIKWTDKMDATPSFGVTMISEVPSNPQLTLDLTAFIDTMDTIYNFFSDTQLVL